MAGQLDVEPEVLRSIADSFDGVSRHVDELSLPDGVDGGIATADILLLLADLATDLGSIAGDMQSMSHRLAQTRTLYLESDADAAEAIFLAGSGG